VSANRSSPPQDLLSTNSITHNNKAVKWETKAIYPLHPREEVQQTTNRAVVE